MKYLKDIYATVSNKDILESLNWCKTTYENNKYMTYIAIISCSALGMPGRKYVQEKYDFENDGDHFRPMHLSKIWSWILCNIGMMPVCENYYLSYIPLLVKDFIWRMKEIRVSGKKSFRGKGRRKSNKGGL